MSSNKLPKQKQDSLGVFAGGIAHDFNNILMAILGNADLALDELTPKSPVHTLVSEIHSATLRAADLCRQMLVYSGRGNYEFQVFDLNNLAGCLTQLIDPIVPGKIALNTEISPETALINGDVTQIQQILVNLVSNSVEAIGEEEGSITIKTGLKNCSDDFLVQNPLTAELPPGSYVFMQVTDTGAGMSKQYIEQIFDPFFTTKFAGRGLGLSVVQGIAHGHRGAVYVKSQPKQGATITVLFPSAKPAVKTAQSGDKATDKNTSWLPKGLILLADDELDVRRVASRMLEKIGFEVMLVEDGLQAVETFRDNSDIIDLVILDLTMPRLGGQEAFRQIREIAPGIPVLLSSGYSTGDPTLRLTGCEPSGFIQKPYTQARIKKILQEIAESF